MRNLEAGPTVWRSSAGLQEEDQVTTKRVESSRAPCLDAGSTPAASTPKDGFSPSFFVMTAGVGQPVAVWQTCRRGRVVIDIVAAQLR